MIPKPVIQAAQSAIPVIREALENPGAVMGAFEKSAYEEIAPMMMGKSIRTHDTIAAAAAKQSEEAAKFADDLFPELRTAIPEAQPTILRAGGHTASVRFGSERFGSAQFEPTVPEFLQPWRQQQSGYAQLIFDNAEAYKAASTIERPSIGFTSQMVEVEATGEQMLKTAMEGSLAFLGKGGNANKYTQFLIGRFGSV